MFEGEIKGKINIDFDFIPVILAGRDIIRKQNKQLTGEIYYSENFVEIRGALQRIKNSDSESIRIGILYNNKYHTTPIFIEKVVYNREDEPEKEDELFVYHIDSVVYGFDGEDEFKSNLASLAKYAKVYSLGYEDIDGEIKSTYKRQHDKYSCATFSLFDIEQIFKCDFKKFVQENSVEVQNEKNFYTLLRLPANFMAVLQSVHGSATEDDKFRKGLKQYIAEHRQEASKVFTLLNDIQDLKGNIENDSLEKFINNVISSAHIENKKNNTWMEAVECIMASTYYNALNQNKESMQLNTTLNILFDRIINFSEKEHSEKNLIVSIYNEHYWQLYKKYLPIINNNKLLELNISRLSEDRIFDIASYQAKVIDDFADKNIETYVLSIVVGMVVLISFISWEKNQKQKHADSSLADRISFFKFSRAITISDEDMAKSVFGQSSNTANLYRRKF